MEDGSPANPSPKATLRGREVHSSQKRKKTHLNTRSILKPSPLSLVFVAVPSSAGLAGKWVAELGCSSSSV